MSNQRNQPTPIELIYDKLRKVSKGIKLRTHYVGRGEIPVSVLIQKTGIMPWSYRILVSERIFDAEDLAFDDQFSGLKGILDSIPGIVQARPYSAISPLQVW